MFLKQVIDRNQKLVNCAIDLHQKGMIQPDSYVIDVDTFLDNAYKILKCAKKNHIELFFMLKQLGRNPYLAKKLIEMGYDGAVVVDYKEAKIMIDHHIPIGNIGHLVQIPNHQLTSVIQSKPKQITVYSLEKIKQINQIAHQLNQTVSIVLKVYNDGDLIYDGQEGGFHIDELEELVKEIQQFKNIKINGITAFPCILYNSDNQQMEATPNAYTLIKAKNILEKCGCQIQHLNMPSATCVESLSILKELGCHQGEPGHALTGTTPWHQDHYNEQNENIAYVYVSEISHYKKNKAYCYGGGYYRRGHLEKAFVNHKIYSAFPPSDSAIDYHLALEKGDMHIGDTVIMCYRTQMFVTRSDIVLVEGLSKNKTRIIGIYDGLGKKVG